MVGKPAAMEIVKLFKDIAIDLSVLGQHAVGAELHLIDQIGAKTRGGRRLKLTPKRVADRQPLAGQLCITPAQNFFVS